MYFVFNCDGMSSILHIFFSPQPLHFCHGILFSIYFHVKQIVLNSHQINSFGFVFTSHWQVFSSLFCYLLLQRKELNIFLYRNITRNTISLRPWTILSHFFHYIFPCQQRSLIVLSFFPQVCILIFYILLKHKILVLLVLIHTNVIVLDIILFFFIQ